MSDDMKKGIAIAMETIVYIILAVLVLAILLYFLTSQAGPAQSEAELQLARAELCLDYTAYDSTCENPNKIPSNAVTKKNKNLLAELFRVCKAISGTRCSGQLTPACIQTCCFVCPTRPS